MRRWLAFRRAMFEKEPLCQQYCCFRGFERQTLVLERHAGHNMTRAKSRTMVLNVRGELTDIHDSSPLARSVANGLDGIPLGANCAKQLAANATRGRGALPTLPAYRRP